MSTKKIQNCTHLVHPVMILCVRVCIRAKSEQEPKYRNQPQLEFAISSRSWSVAEVNFLFKTGAGIANKVRRPTSHVMLFKTRV